MATKNKNIKTENTEDLVINLDNIPGGQQIATQQGEGLGQELGQQEGLNQQPNQQGNPTVVSGQEGLVRQEGVDQLQGDPTDPVAQILVEKMASTCGQFVFDGDAMTIGTRFEVWLAR